MGVLYIPRGDELIMPILATTPLQMLAYQIALIDLTISSGP